MPARYIVSIKVTSVVNCVRCPGEGERKVAVTFSRIMSNFTTFKTINGTPSASGRVGMTLMKRCLPPIVLRTTLEACVYDMSPRLVDTSTFPTKTWSN